MNLDRHLDAVNRLFLDTAPVIYYVEANPYYITGVETLFARLDTGDFQVVTSPITLAECLIVPYRDSNIDLQQAFIDVITNGVHTHFVTIDESVSTRAAELRARYNLGLADALQFAVALEARCDAFLTNDIMLKRVTELEVIVLSEVINR